MPEVVAHLLASYSSTLRVDAVNTMLVVHRGVKSTDNVPRRVFFDGVCSDAKEARQMQSIVEDACGFVSLRTNGDGACGLHAAFGNLANGVEFFCEGARARAADALRLFRSSGRPGCFVREILTPLWCELAKPVVMHELGRAEVPPPHAQVFLVEVARRRP